MNKPRFGLFSTLRVPGTRAKQGRLLGWRLAFGLILLVLFASMGGNAALGAPTGSRQGTSDAETAHFAIQRVDAPKLFHSMSSRSLRLDSNKRPHIAYGGDYLYYASYDGSAWQVEVGDSAPGVGAFASLALDANNQPHISYYDAINGTLKYATKTGIGWQVETVDGPALDIQQQNLLEEDVDGSLPPAGDADQREWRYYLENPVLNEDGQAAPLALAKRGVGMYTSIAVDAFGHPSISYYDEVNGDLKYAHWTGSAWDIRTIDSDNNVGMYSSLAMNANGNPSISYYDATNKDLWYATYKGTKWEFKKLDSTDDVGLYTSIIMDAGGRPHISYYDRKNGNLKYIRNTSSGWTTPVIVDGAGDVGQYTSIGLAGGNALRPFISYFDATNSDLKYAYKLDNAWVKETIASNELLGRFTSLDMDGGSPRISYYDSGRGTLKYAIKTGSHSWTVQTVDDSADVGLSSSLAMDAGGNPHISYYDDTQNNLKYASWTGSAWDITTVDIPGSVGLYTSLKIDSAGHPHISYFDSKNDAIKYARWTGSNWIIQTIASGIGSASQEGMGTSLVLDSQDRPRIAYYDGKNKELRVALWTGITWLIRIVDNTDNTGKYPSMAIDNADRLHVSYYNVTNKSLRYAVGAADGSSWNKQTIDTDSNGLYTSIALDNANFPHIAYFEDIGDNLRYARWTGTQWEKVTVDSEGIVGWFASLGLDNLGRPHISYYDYGNRNLKYATWNGSAWQIQIVDDYGEVGQNTSLAFMPNGSPAISYYDATNGDLKFAAYLVYNYTNFVFLPLLKK